MTHPARTNTRWSLFCLLLLPFLPVSATAQTPTPGPLHLRSHSQKIQDFLALPTGNIKVADATRLLSLVADPTDAQHAEILGRLALYQTSDGGSTWGTDFVPLLSVPGFSDPASTTQNSLQTAVGISLDRTGHAFVALQEPAGPNNRETANQVAVAEGPGHGQYLGNVPAVVAIGSCDAFNSCNEELYAQGVVTDLSGTATDGKTYVYYLVSCIGFTHGCEGGLIPGGSSTLFATASAGAGQPFHPIGLVSNTTNFLDVVGASAIVESAGTPHFIYADLSASPTVNLVLDRQSSQLLSFSQAGFNNPNIVFSTGVASVTPACATRGHFAFCAFNAGSISTAAPETYVTVYLAIIDLQTGKATVTQVNNDPVGKGKDHFNPSVAITANGDIYVGFFDDRRDPADKKLDYFLAKSTDGGSTFPLQQPVNDISFPIRIGAPVMRSPSFSGSIAAGPDGTVHAAWTDTRDGASVQVYSQNVQW